MITKNLLNILLMSITLAQISQAKPTPQQQLENLALLTGKDVCFLKTKYDQMEPSEKDGLLSPSNQLLKFTLKEFQDLSLKYVKKAKNISEHMLMNDQILTSQSMKILEFKKNLTRFEEKYSLCDGIEELFELLEFYSNSTSFYFQLNATSLDDDAQLILKLLRKYGSKDLDMESMELFNIFVDKFDEKFESLKENLRQQEGQLGKKMLEWFAHFKALTNYDDKIAAFEKFFMLFEDEQD